MIILITGSAGMLGSDLCRLLTEGEYSFSGSDIMELQRQELPEDRYRVMDITNLSAIRRVFAEVNPDIVIHAAAYTAVDDCETKRNIADSINRKGAANIASVCKEAGAAMLYISTDYVFDGKKQSPYAVDDQINPLSEYGRSKLSGEKAVREILPDRHVIVRTSWLYGKDGPNFVDKIIKKAEAGNKLNIVDDQIGSPTYTRDLAAALIGIIGLIEKGGFTQSDYGTYHITNSGSCSWYDYAKKIIDFEGIKAEVSAIKTNDLRKIYIEAGNKKYAERPAHSVLSNKRFNELTAVPMRPWQDALREYLRSKSIN
ncbi:MAG: dTDP-4-dehydrorhamnose reductase [Candidatus Omnitrophica bacterium]|nr:dTDP-4-dehydrorhamnose reductase [Candidatus Omnitrophota bacterium]